MTATSLGRRVFRERRAVVLPLLLLLAVNIVALLAGVLPLRRSVSTAREAAAATAREREAAVRQQQAAADLVARRDTADVELTTFYGDVLPGNLNEARRLLQVWLYRIARDRDLQFASSESEHGEMEDSQLRRVESQVRLQGRYADIRRFIHDVETGTGFVIVEDVQLAETSATADAGSVDLLLTVATYFMPATTGGS